MRIILWVFRLVLFVLLLAFAIKNDGLVRVEAFFDTAWDVPLVVVMFVAFGAGAVMGVASLAITIVSMRREINTLKKQAPAAQSEFPPASARGRFTDISDTL